MKQCLYLNQQSKKPCVPLTGMALAQSGVCIAGLLTDHAAIICAVHVQVKQKGGTVEQIVVADMAFDVLKTAWAKFESGELRK